MIARQVDLVAKWVLIGFIHGVMNTDNMSIAGETIDYGPCAFMDTYHPETVFSSIDHLGRYAYDNQPRIAQWNLARFAETLLPLLAEDTNAAVEVAQTTLADFMPLFELAFAAGLRRKLGLLRTEPGDTLLAKDLLDRMAANSADFTLTFRRLCDAAANTDKDIRGLFDDPGTFDAWATLWRARLTAEGGDPAERIAVMRNANPAFIPRNHRVEEAITAAQDQGNFGPFETLVTVLAAPYEDQPGFARYAEPPPRSGCAPDVLRNLNYSHIVNCRSLTLLLDGLSAEVEAGRFLSRGAAISTPAFFSPYHGRKALRLCLRVQI